MAINCGVEEEKIIIINPGVDSVEEIKKENLDKAEKFLKNKKPRLITVARYDKRKNHEKIIMALKNLKQMYPNIVYCCVGYGEEEETWEWEETPELLAAIEQLSKSTQVVKDLKSGYNK